MDIVIISEASNESLHPVTAQMVGAASSIGGQISVICPGGVGSREAAKIAGVSKVISVEGDCFDSYDCMAWSNAIVTLHRRGSCADIFLGNWKGDVIGHCSEEGFSCGSRHHKPE